VSESKTLADVVAATEAAEGSALPQRIGVAGGAVPSFLARVSAPTRRDCCGACTFFTPRSSAIGQCRKRAPGASGWPPIAPDEWCGDFDLKVT
jgi:hypothetical protein